VSVSSHQLSILVFRAVGRSIEYLFVRRQPEQEFDWNPLLTPVRPAETLRTAATRHLREWGRACEPEPWVDLHTCGRFLVGDVDLVSWLVGYGVDSSWNPDAAGAVVRVRWEPLPSAFQILEDEAARTALFRLHLHVAGG
jgi:hypothetical protein